MLVFEQILVHSPELALRGRCLGPRGRGAGVGMGMNLPQWEMPKDEGQLAAACILQRMDASHDRPVSGHVIVAIHTSWTLA
jgi:hypothetical protein